MNDLKAVIAVYDNFTLYHTYKNQKLGPGKNITIKNIKSIFKLSLYDNMESLMSFNKFIPENVLNFDPVEGSVIFYTKPEMRNLIFSKDLNFNVKLEDQYKMPFLLWVYKNNILSVFALKRKPTKLTDKLYNTPFLNVSSRGNVCMGNVKYGDETKYFDVLIKDIVYKFYNSVFTHTNNDNLLKMNYVKFLELHKNDKNLSYSKLLIENGLTLNDVL